MEEHLDGMVQNILQEDEGDLCPDESSERDEAVQDVKVKGLPIINIEED